MKPLATLGTACETTGHPTECQEPVSGELQDNDGHRQVTLNGVPLADHGDRMHFPDHAHSYNAETDACENVQSHNVRPQDIPPVTVNGKPVMREGDQTTDPGSGGTASIRSGESNITHTP